MLLSGAFALAVLPGAYAGHPVGHAPYVVFKSMDADNDGHLTHEEYSAGSRQLFAHMDTNHDGQVSLAELTAIYALDAGQAVPTDRTGANGLAAEIMAKYDTNHDGQLSATEQAAGDEAMFMKLDTNHDGWLSQTECEAGVKMLKRDK